jgi:hypothetical protein
MEECATEMDEFVQKGPNIDLYEPKGTADFVGHKASYI